MMNGFDNIGLAHYLNGFILWDWLNSRQHFEKRSECFVRQYSNYILLDGQAIDGTLTLGRL